MIFNYLPRRFAREIEPKAPCPQIIEVQFSGLKEEIDPIPTRLEDLGFLDPTRSQPTSRKDPTSGNQELRVQLFCPFGNNGRCLAHAMNEHTSNTKFTHCIRS